MREIVENYYSSTFVPNPTTGHIAYLAHGSPEEQVNYLKGRRKGKGGKGKKGGDNNKGKERAKEEENKETTKEKEKDTTMEEKDTTKDGFHGVKEDTTTTAIKDKEEEKEKEER